MKILYTLIITLFFLSCSLLPEDCAGDVYGDAYIDACGICDEDSTNDNRTCEQDCTGTWGGSAYIDACGFCDEDTQNDCLCEGHSFNLSTQQAFYFFRSVTLDGMPIDSNDWVITVNNDIVVGAREWNIADCGGGLCDVPVMGDDGLDSTDGYMAPGGVPLFVIYDTSLDRYYEATAAEPVDVWSNNGLFMNDSLKASRENRSNCD